MSTSEIANWLVSQDSFQAELQKLVKALARNQFHIVRTTMDDQASDFNLQYLLFSASILAQAENRHCRDAALRIATYALTAPITPDESKSAAACVFQTLANHRGVALAQELDFLHRDYESQIPFTHRLDQTKRRLAYTVQNIAGDSLQLNQFQIDLWRALKSAKKVSCSAPTSAGKSFLIETWATDFLESAGPAIGVFIVPSRALISQVEYDLAERIARDKLKNVEVSSIPLASQVSENKATAFVFTQERLHIFLGDFAATPALDLLVVDEAQKIGDGARGVLLQQVVERVLEVNPSVNVAFASPQTSNPELLLEDFGEDEARVVVGSDITVAQNLFWVSQVRGRPKEWMLDLCEATGNARLGVISLSSKPTGKLKRLSFIAEYFGRQHFGNIVYANGAADAEKASQHIFELTGDTLSDGQLDKDVADLIELCSSAIHPKYCLNKFLRRGVAFHYGNIPLLIRNEIERLFSLGKIKFLSCTSTLVEGVNTSCKNIFLRGPTKGKGRPMTESDFWNLAGRAGRWGREFQGNIFCIDPADEKVWRNPPPRNRTVYEITKTSDKVLNDAGELVEYIRDGTPLTRGRERPELEYVFSYLCAEWINRGEALSNVDIKADPQLEELKAVVHDIMAANDINQRTVVRNPGISPISMEKLLKYFRERSKPIDELIPSDPQSEEAAVNFAAIFGRIHKFLNPSLGPGGPRAFTLAILVVRWMRGYPLSRLIDDRWKYYQSRGRSKKLDTTIREVMNDVEQIARFQAPKFLACYSDILRQHLNEVGEIELATRVNDFAIYLEFGVSTTTEISLIGLGLSRTAAVRLMEFATNDEMSESATLEWLKNNLDILESQSIPALVRKEILRLLDDEIV